MKVLIALLAKIEAFFKANPVNESTIRLLACIQKPHHSFKTGVHGFAKERAAFAAHGRIQIIYCPCKLGAIRPVRLDVRGCKISAPAGQPPV